jgi:hypothetical protein
MTVVVSVVHQRDSFDRGSKLRNVSAFSSAYRLRKNGGWLWSQQGRVNSNSPIKLKIALNVRLDVQKPTFRECPLSAPEAGIQLPKHDGPLQSASLGRPPRLGWTPKQSGKPHSGSKKRASCVLTGEPAFPPGYPIV